MANELAGTVTATPAGPVAVGYLNTIDISASFTLDGASGGVLLSQSMSWERDGVVSWASEDPVVDGVVYTKTLDPDVMGFTIGDHTVRVYVTQIFDTIPGGVTTYSNTIEVKIQRFSETEGPATITMTEETAPAAAMTEESAPAGTFTEETAATTAMTEESPSSTTWTEETQA
jgi:hypothetical protein